MAELLAIRASDRYISPMRAIFFLAAALPATLLAQPDTITVGALQRTYTLRLPSTYNGADVMPMVIAMHGGFGSGAQLEEQSGLTEKGEQEGFIVVYPDGVAGTLNIRTWNAGGCCGYAMNNHIDDVGFINALLDTLIAGHAIDTQRIYATGMSNGGFMSYRLACELSERIAAIAPVSASMTIDVCQPSRPVPVIALHSFLDTSVPYLGGVGDGVSIHYNSPQDSVQTAFALHADCAVLNDTVQNDSALTVVSWRDCDCGQEMLLYMTRDGGHSWPGGTQTVIGDPPSQVISANDLMWEFFTQHPLDCLPTSTATSTHRATLFAVVPQPSTGDLRIIGEGLVELVVFDTGGRALFHQRHPPADLMHYDLSHLPPGVYAARITDQMRRSASRTVILVAD